MSLSKRLLLLAALAAPGAITACSRRAQGTIFLAAAGPTTSANGIANMKGFRLAIDEINGAPGRSFKLDTIVRDDSGNGGAAARVAQDFVNDPRIVAVVGHVNSGTMMAAARVYDGHLPAVATSATSPSLSGISKWAFRVISSDSLNGLRVAEHMNKLGRKRAMILYENNAYGRGLVESFKRGFSGEIVGTDPVSDKAGQDLEPFVTWLKQKQADVVFVAGSDKSAVSFLKEARRQQLTAAFAGGNGWAVLVNDPLAEGAYFPTPFNARDPRPDVQAFVAAYQKKYNGELPSAYAALAYDATKLLAQAIDHVGADRAKIRDYLANLSTPYQGVTGAIVFAPNGDPKGKTMAMARIHDKAIVAEAAQ